MKNIRRAIARDLVYTGVIALFLAGAAALAQGTREQLPNGDQNPNAPALRGPDSTQTAQVGEMEVLNGPVSFHTRNYLSFGLLANIRTNWRRALTEKGLIPASDQKAFTVEFTVLKDGTLDSRKVVESSGDRGTRSYWPGCGCEICSVYGGPGRIRRRVPQGAMPLLPQSWQEDTVCEPRRRRELDRPMLRTIRPLRGRVHSGETVGVLSPVRFIPPSRRLAIRPGKPKSRERSC